MTISGSVTQWEIFDAYQEDFEKQVRASVRACVRGRAWLLPTWRAGLSVGFVDMMTFVYSNLSIYYSFLLFELRPS